MRQRIWGWGVLMGAVAHLNLDPTLSLTLSLSLCQRDTCRRHNGASQKEPLGGRVKREWHVAAAERRRCGSQETTKLAPPPPLDLPHPLTVPSHIMLNPTPTPPKKHPSMAADRRRAVL